MKKAYLLLSVLLPMLMLAEKVDIPLSLSVTNNNQLTITEVSPTEWDIAITSGDPIDPYVYTLPINTPYTADVKFLVFEYQYAAGGEIEFFYYKPSNGSAPENPDPNYFLAGNYLIPTTTWKTKVIDLSRTEWFDAQQFRIDFSQAQNTTLKIRNLKLSNYQDVAALKVLEYKFENNLNDATTINNHGAFGGDGAMAYDAAGKVGSAALFNNQNNWVQTPANIFVPGNDYTIDLWVKVENTLATSTAGITIIQQAGTTGRTLLGVSSATGKFFAFIGAGLDFQAAPVYNQWTHIVLAFQQAKKTLKVYVNDQFDSEFTNVVYSGNVSTDVLRFGQHKNANTTRDFVGLIDEVKIYNTALSYYTIAASSENTSKGSVSGAGSYLEGTVISVNAIPANGYKFEDWRENGNLVSTDANYTFDVSFQRNLVATFSNITTVNNVYSTSNLLKYNKDNNCVITIEPAREILCYDLQGRVVEYVSNTAILNTGSLSQGVYLVKAILQNGNTETLKIVK